MEGWIDEYTGSHATNDFLVLERLYGKADTWFVLNNVIVSTCVILSISEPEEALVMN